MNAIKSTKAAYDMPTAATVDIAPRDSVLQIISNPGGTVPGLDPEEG